MTLGFQPVDIAVRFAAMRWMSLEPLLACLVVIGGTGASKADDFLYVIGALPGQAAEIQWLPVDSPSSARVLVEGMLGARSVYRYGNELWALPQAAPVVSKTDLMGQDRESLSLSLNLDALRLVRHGESIYWIRPRHLSSFNFMTKDGKVLAEARTEFQSLAIYEDRLYFGSPNRLDSIRLDGTELREEAPSLRTTALAVFGNSLFGGGGTTLWQMNLFTGVIEILDTQLPHRLIDLAVSREGIYWIGNDTVWRRRHWTSADTKVYQLGDTELESLCVVSAKRHPMQITSDRRLLLEGAPRVLYQVLYSEDLATWSPNLDARDLFMPDGFLQWLKPQRGLSEEALSWRPLPTGRQAYFAAWEYEAESFDRDRDDLPDYWERRHLGGLGTSGELDADGDGLSDREELGVLSDPNVADTDGDGLTDQEEVAFVPSLIPTNPDSDGDALSDGEEVRLHRTNPTVQDTDGDGYLDAFELRYESDPLSARSIPNGGTVLADYAEDLLIHYDFDLIEDGQVRNSGRVGGPGRVVGESVRLVAAEETATASSAIEINGGLADAEVTSIHADVPLGDLGLGSDDSEMTIALWIRSQDSSEVSLVSAVDPLSGVDRLIRPNLRDPFLLVLRTGTVLTQIGRMSHSGQSVINESRWHHLAWTVRAGVWQVFVDGALVSEVAASEEALPSDFPLTIGAVNREAGASHPFRGGLDDLRIYRRALSSSVIQVLRQSGL